MAPYGNINVEDNIGSGNGLLLAITWTNADLLSIRNFRNKPQWNFYQNNMIFIQEDVFENVICQMVAILPRPQWILSHSLGSLSNFLGEMPTLESSRQLAEQMGSINQKYTECIIIMKPGCLHNHRWAWNVSQRNSRCCNSGCIPNNRRSTTEGFVHLSGAQSPLL